MYCMWYVLNNVIVNDSNGSFIIHYLLQTWEQVLTPMEQHHHPHASPLYLWFPLLHHLPAIWCIQWTWIHAPVTISLLVKYILYNKYCTTWYYVYPRHAMDTIRNWIAYASFLTMAAIAVTRSVGCLLFQNNLNNVSRTIFNSTTTALGCLFIWGLAFATISLHAFSIKIGSYYFNDIVTYDVRNGTCHSVKSKTLDGTHSGSFLLNFAFFIPLFLILISYIFISIFLEVDKRRRELVLGNQTQVPVTQIQLTLLALSAAVILFCLPLLIFENIDFEDTDYKIMTEDIIHSWYWWMYAVDFIIYVTTLNDFRKMYMQVLHDFNICSPMQMGHNSTLLSPSSVTTVTSKC